MNLLSVLVPTTTLAITVCYPRARAQEFPFTSQSSIRDWPRWCDNQSEPEQHGRSGLRRLTRDAAVSETVLLCMNDAEVSDHPQTYVSDAGSTALHLSAAMVLHERPLRGRVLLVDDFHTACEWQQFEKVMLQVFPDRPNVNQRNGSETSVILCNLARREQIQGIETQMSGRTFENVGSLPRLRGFTDEQGRVMVAINYNQVFGDDRKNAGDASQPAALTAQTHRPTATHVLNPMTH